MLSLAICQRYTCDSIFAQIKYQSINLLFYQLFRHIIKIFDTVIFK